MSPILTIVLGKDQVNHAQTAQLLTGDFRGEFISAGRNFIAYFKCPLLPLTGIVSK